MSRMALLADAHGNLTALEAVLADAHKAGAAEVVFLGDVVGYGPQPVECIELLERECGPELRLMGNHDHACVHSEEFDFFSLYTRRAIEWTHRVLQGAVVRSGAKSQTGLAWLSVLKEKVEAAGALCVHGSPRDPVGEYVSPRDYEGPFVLQANFPLISHLCFMGHTHIPGVMEETPHYRWRSPGELRGRYAVTPGKAMINVGSVGQPRDGDPRACYALFDGESVEWRRVSYDVAAVVERMKAILDLDAYLGQRLLKGR